MCTYATKCMVKHQCTLGLVKILRMHRPKKKKKKCVRYSNLPGICFLMYYTINVTSGKENKEISSKAIKSPQKVAFIMFEIINVA